MRIPSVVKVHIAFVLVVLLMACGNSDPSEETTESTVDTENTASSEEPESGSKPSPLLLEFVGEISQKGWVSDTARIRKVQLYGLQHAELKLIEGTPFYSIPYSHSTAHTMMKMQSSADYKNAQQAFSEVEQIWGYYCREKESEGWIPDGMIEQWTFPGEKEATNALKHFEKLGNQIFFNTMPFFCQQENNVFVFHARAMGFSYHQKPLFEAFLGKIDAAGDRN